MLLCKTIKYFLIWIQISSNSTKWISSSSTDIKYWTLKATAAHWCFVLFSRESEEFYQTIRTNRDINYAGLLRTAEGDIDFPF